jgi:hypothetical protein
MSAFGLADIECTSSNVASKVKRTPRNLREYPFLTQSGHKQPIGRGTAIMVVHCRRDEQVWTMLEPEQRQSNAAFDPYFESSRVPNRYAWAFDSKVVRVWSRGCGSNSSRKPIAI